jgi:DNA ligase-4
MTESAVPEKKTKAELEQLVKANGGKIYQTNTAAQDTICIADRSKLRPLKESLSETILILYRNRQSGLSTEERTD